MWLRNKIVLQSIAIAVPLLVLRASGTWYVLPLQPQHSEILEVDLASVRAAEEMAIIIAETRCVK